MKNTIKANLVKNTDSGLVTSVSGAVFVLAFWDSKSCFLTSILPKFYPLVRLLKTKYANRFPGLSKLRALVTVLEGHFAVKLASKSKIFIRL